MAQTDIQYLGASAPKANSGKNPGPDLLQAWAEQERQDNTMRLVAEASAKPTFTYHLDDRYEADFPPGSNVVVSLDCARTRAAFRAGELPKDRPAPPPMVPLIDVTDETRRLAESAMEAVREELATPDADPRAQWCFMAHELVSAELFETGGICVADADDEPLPKQAEILDQFATDHRDAWPGQAEHGGLFAWSDARQILRQAKWAVLQTERAAAARRKAEKAEREDQRKAKAALPSEFRVVDSYLRKINGPVSTDKLKSDLRGLLKRNHLEADEQAQNRLVEGLVANDHIALGKIPARQLVARAVREVVAESKPKRKKSKIAIVNEWSDSEMADWSQDNLASAIDLNGDPRVYDYEGDVCDMHKGQRRMLSEKQFAAINNSVSKYAREKQSGDMRGEFAPKAVVDHNYHRSDKTYFELKEVKSAPFFANDGRRVDEHGYDEPSKTYLDLGGLEVPPVSDKPSAGEVIKAKDLFFEIIGDFPFDGVTDREEREGRFLRNEGKPLPSAAHAVCMMIERAARDLINGPTPVYAPTKPKPGTGAGELVAAITKAATGRKAAAEAMPTTDEEYTKVMSANISESGEFVFFDNMNAALDLGTFASNVTEGRVRARLLGSSRMVEAEVRSTWIAAANNIKGTAEILRRLVMIELDSKLAHPEDRDPKDFRHPDLSAWVEENRPELVWAILTLIQNWVANGMKPWTGKPKGSFVSWSRVMGGILRDAGIRGFLENEERLRSYGATGGDSGVEVFMQHLAAEYPSGTLFRAGGTSPIRGREAATVVSLKDELNVADDGKPLLLDGWGYNREDQQFNHARGITSKFRDVARGAYVVTLYETRPDEKGEMNETPVPYAVSFKEEPDPKAPSQYYWEMVVTEVQS